jgi:drug/metabolite transporter (DMT)-like permease
MPAPQLIGILFALSSAFVWGGGDFSGGLAARRSHQFQVLALSAFSGILLLLVLAMLKGESLPSPTSALWAILAGVMGAVGMAALYRVLSSGHMASAAPTAAAIGAALPVAFNIWIEGLPTTAQLIGFALAFLGIGLTSQISFSNRGEFRQSFVLTVGAGVGFGCFFILIAQVERGLVFTPLIIARSIAFCLALLLLRVRHLPLISLTLNRTALVAGVLDAAGTAFYMLAKQFTRLDIAAMLTSLYPVITVLLAYLVLKETVTRAQWLGVGVCLTAIVLITL